MAWFRTVQDPYNIAASLHNLGHVLLHQGVYDEAREAFLGSLRYMMDATLPDGMAVCVVGIAGVAAATHEAEVAARLLGAFDAYRSTTGLFLGAADRKDYEHIVVAARCLMADAQWEAAWQAGNQMSLEGAVTVALAVSD